MTLYAQHNAAGLVTGWYDTGFAAYPNLPPAADLLEVTEAQWNARLANPSGWQVQNGALAAYTAPVAAPTLAQQAMAAMGQGIKVTSTGTPALEATYACDDAAQAKLNRVSGYIEVNGKFPAGLSAMPWPDITGAVHEFPTTASLQALASAVANYVTELDAVAMGVAIALPPATATIP